MARSAKPGALIYLSLAGVAALGALALLAFVFPWAIVVAVGVFAVISFHYFTWGWWLGPLLKSEYEASNELQPRETVAPPPKD